MKNDIKFILDFFLKLLIFINLFLLCNIKLNINNVYANENNLSITNYMSDIQKNEILNNIEFKVDYTEKKGNIISSFSVNKDGYIALGLTDSEKQYINIYDQNGDYLYSYTFNISGSYDFEWDNYELIIYIYRGELAFKLDSNKNCCEMYTYTGCDYSYVTNHFNKTVFKINDCEYKIEKIEGPLKHIAVHYSKLSITDKSGNINVVYDISNDYQTSICIKLFFGIIFIVVWLINFKKLLLKLKHKDL